MVAKCYDVSYLTKISCRLTIICRFIYLTMHLVVKLLSAARKGMYWIILVKVENEDVCNEIYLNLQYCLTTGLGN